MQKNIDLMETAPVGRAIILLAIPSVLAMLVQIIYGLTDTYFVSRLGDPNLVAAISLVMPFAMLIQAVGNIFAFGGASYISRMLGEKKELAAQKTCSTAFYCSIILGVLVAIGAFFITEPILSLLGTSPATRQPAKEYMAILVMFSFIQILQIVLAGLIRSEGATKQAMIGILVGTGVNMVLDYLFILVFMWGIAGAAWATIIGNCCGVLYYLLYFKYSRTILSLRLSLFRPDKQMIFEMLAIGFPAAMNSFIMSASHIITNNLAISYGENVMAANGIVMRLVAIALFLIMGIAQGYQPFAGYNFGARHFDRLKSAFLFALGFATAIGVSMGIVFYFWGADLLNQFLKNDDVIAKGMAMMRPFVWSMPLFGVHFLISMTFQATGKAVSAFILVLVRQALFFLPMLFILNALYGFTGFIYAQPLADMFTTVMAVALFVWFLRHLPKNQARQI